MNRNYNVPRVSFDWANSRNTHIAVATAIHAIASTGRTPEQIWLAPTAEEWDHVTMAVGEYIANGDFKASYDYCYPWGEETITLPPHIIG
jgi:hypothetical protein